jgi:hypothetical protein
MDAQQACYVEVRFLSGLGSWPLKMGPIRCPETSVKNDHTTPRNIPEERKYHQHRGGSLKLEHIYPGDRTDFSSRYARVVSPATWITFLLLVKIAFPPCTCYPANHQAARLRCVRTVLSATRYQHTLAR